MQVLLKFGCSAIESKRPSFSVGRHQVCWAAPTCGSLAWNVRESSSTKSLPFTARLFACEFVGDTFEPMTPENPTRRIEVGDDVILPIGKVRLAGRVLEDRGPLGVNGERILLIVNDLEIGAHHKVREVPETALELA
jgi:hypothetical protein